MNESYGRDLDLNLLRVFVVVAEERSVTRAAARLYLTQPAVSAALKRLSRAVGAELFARQGRGLALTARGQRLLGAARPHLAGLLNAAFSPAVFDPSRSDRVVRLGMSDASESWLLPALLRELAERAPLLRLVVAPVQFRTVAEALSASRVDLAITVADDLPAGTSRRALFAPPPARAFVCLFDPRHTRWGAKPSRRQYLAGQHVVVSYNGDLRGVVEDVLGVTRNVRLSVPSFQAVGSVVDDSALIATVPAIVARGILEVRPHLRLARLPFRLVVETGLELIWRDAVLDDEAVRFVHDLILRVAQEAARRTWPVRRPPRDRPRRQRP